jgi:hypothetical protein
MGVDPLLEERAGDEEESPDEGPVVCHAEPDEPEGPPEPEKEPGVVCQTPGRPDEPKTPPEREAPPEPERGPEPVICHSPPVICHAPPGEEEIEVEVIEIEIEEEIVDEPEPPAGLEERWRASAGDVADGEFERTWSELIAFLRAAATSREPMRPPSRRVDDLWHEFILYTRDYHTFCERIGGYVHHVPEVPTPA